LDVDIEAWNSELVLAASNATVWMSWNLELEINTNTNRHSSHPFPLVPDAEPDPSVFAGIGSLSLASLSRPFLPVGSAVAVL